MNAAIHDEKKRKHSVVPLGQLLLSLRNCGGPKEETQVATPQAWRSNRPDSPDAAPALCPLLAANFPNKAINLVVPYAAGGAIPAADLA
jgi:hypothetical protein